MRREMSEPPHGGPCAVCGMTSHATRYHDEFEAYIRERRPRPPTEPEGEEIEAMMTALGLNSPPAAARALPEALPCLLYTSPSPRDS